MDNEHFTHRHFDPNRKGEICWVLIYDLPTGATSTTACLNEDSLPRKDAKCELIAEEVDQEEEYSLSTIAITGVNLVVAVANVISLARLHCRVFVPKDHPPRKLNQPGERGDSRLSKDTVGLLYNELD